MTGERIDIGPADGFEVNVWWLTKRFPGSQRLQTFLNQLWRYAGPAGNVRLSALGTPAVAAADYCPVVVGYDLAPWRWAGATPTVIHLGPAGHDWEFRPVLLDDKTHLTTDALAAGAWHELGHYYGVYGSDHVGEGGPDYLDRFRAR